MSNEDDKIVIRIELDESSTGETLDEISRKTKEAFNSKEASELNSEIENLTGSIDSLNDQMDEVVSNSSVADINMGLLATSTGAASGSFDSMLSSVESIHQGFMRTAISIKGFRQGVLNLGKDINTTIDSIQFFLTLFTDLIRFTSLSKNAFLSDLLPSIKKVNNAITDNREGIETALDRYKKFVNIKEKIVGIFSAVGKAVHLATSLLSGLVVLVGVKAIIAGENLAVAYISAFGATRVAILAAATSARLFAVNAIGGLLTGARALVVDYRNVSAVFAHSGKSLFRLADASITLAAKLGIVTALTAGFGVELTAIPLKILAISTAVSALVAFGLIVLIRSFADLISSIGTKLTGAFRESFKAFVVFRKETVQFTETLKAFSKETDGASGSVDSWNKSILVLNKTLNFSIGDLRKASAEIVAVGSRMGFTEGETKKLLKVVADYATISGKDLFQTTVAFAGALQGNAQAVQAYGVKLTAASNATFAFKQGNEKSFLQMTELEKEQVRLNNLMSQHAVVTGVATAVANDWFNQTKKLEATQARLNTQVGLGAAYIEDLNLAALSLNKVLSNVSDGTARLFGFMGALSGRLFQIIGFTIKWSFTLFLVYRSLLLIDVLLKSNIWLGFASKTLPFINKSLHGMAFASIGAQTNLVGLKNTLKTFIKVLAAQRIIIAQWILGISGATTVLGGFVKLIYTRALGALALLTAGFTAVIVPILPFIIAGAAIIAIWTAIVKAFILIERETKFFSIAFEQAFKAFDNFLNLFDGAADIFSAMKNALMSVAGVSFGFLIKGILKLLRLISVMVIKNPLGTFSKKVVHDFTAARMSIDVFSERLTLAGNNVFKLGKILMASSAEARRAAFDFEKFANTVRGLQDATTPKIEKINKQFRDRIKIIKEALAAEVATESMAADLKNRALLDKQKQINELLRQEIGKTGEDVVFTEARLLNQRMMLINTFLRNRNISENRANDLRKVVLADYNEALDRSTGKQLTQLELVMQQYNLTAGVAKKAMEAQASITAAGTDIIVGAFERLGASLVEGGAAWSDFGAFLLNKLGDLMIKVGIASLGIGTALTAIATAIANLNGAVAVAAGVALIVAGGALKALGKKQGGGTFTPATQGISSGAPVNIVGISPTAGVNPREDTDREEPGRNVIINVDGSIFSTEQTSKTLISMISKEFDKTGADIRKKGFA